MTVTSHHSPSNVSPATPSVVVVMGVSGSGKSTIGAMLAQQLGWDFEDADNLHPAANIDKMRSGIPLTDEDRWPWLAAVASWIDAVRSRKGHAVMACSALKRRYRDLLIGGRADVRLIYLRGDEDLIAQRITARRGHFMTASLLRSQFEDLEEPVAQENALVVSIDDQPGTLVKDIVAALRTAQQ